MAIPVQPTNALICTEAYKLFGISSPTSAQLTRAADYGMEITKSDLKDMGLEWDFLRQTGYLILTAGVSYVQLPTDYAKIISARVLDGTRGTAQSNTGSSVTLASTFGGGTETVGKYLVVTGATAGSGQAKIIKSYDSTTKVATLDSSFDTTPTGTVTYLIVDRHTELDHENLFDASTNHQINNVQGAPSKAWIKSDAAEGDLYLDRTPDQIYAIELEYYADILKIDLTSTLYSRILRLLNGLFIQGVFIWLLQDDTRVVMERQIYEKKKAQTAGLYLYPYNLSSFSSRLDYK